jgi:hypothetical protein
MTNHLRNRAARHLKARILTIIVGQPHRAHYAGRLADASAGR